jgi:hypothetical protein
VGQEIGARYLTEIETKPFVEKAVVGRFALPGRGSAKGFQGQRASQAVMPTSPAS